MRLVAVLLLILPLAALAHEEREVANDPLSAVRAAEAEGAAPAIEPGTSRLQVTVSGTIQLQ